MDDESKESMWGFLIFLALVAIIIGLFTYTYKVKSSNKDAAMAICVQTTPYIECYDVIKRVRPLVSPGAHPGQPLKSL